MHWNQECAYNNDAGLEMTEREANGAEKAGTRPLRKDRAISIEGGRHGLERCGSAEEGQRDCMGNAIDANQATKRGRARIGCYNSSGSGSC
jgi:hypothetical protein